MIKIDNMEFQISSEIESTLEQLSIKKFIFCNHGIGDFIIASRVAKLLNCGIIQTVCNDMPYRKIFSRELANLENIKRIELPLCRNDKLSRKIKQKYESVIIHQYDSPNLYTFSKYISVDKFMKEALSTKLNINYRKKIKNLVFVCPRGSGSDTGYRRHLLQSELDELINKLYDMGKIVILIGIEKDINFYKFDKEITWINTNEITNKNNKTKIDLKTFLEIVSMGEAAITVNTYFHFLTNIMDCQTFVIHSVNDDNQPVITHENEVFFLNLNWTSNKFLATIPEILQMISK
jgi:hypothetical protein